LGRRPEKNSRDIDTEYLDEDRSGVDGRRISFGGQAGDDKEIIGTGTASAWSSTSHACRCRLEAKRVS